MNHIPRLELANQGREFTVSCVQCRRRVIAGNKMHGEAVYADLNGAPFKDYYCGNCAGELRAACYKEGSR